MRQVLRSRRLEGKLFDFSPGRQSQYEIYAKLTKEVLASKVRKEERRKELIINLLAILSFWMLQVSNMLTKEFLIIRVLINTIFYWISDADNTICASKLTLLLSSFIRYSPLFLICSFIFLIFCHFISAWKRKFCVQVASQVERLVSERKSLYALDQFALKK